MFILYKHSFAVLILKTKNKNNAHPRPTVGDCTNVNSSPKFTLNLGQDYELGELYRIVLIETHVITMLR